MLLTEGSVALPQEEGGGKGARVLMISRTVVL